MKWPDEQGCVSDAKDIAWKPVKWSTTIEPPPLFTYMEGTIFLYYSPGCRAAFVEWDMSIVRHGDFYPQLWLQPKYGGRSRLLTPPENTYQLISGGDVDMGPAVVRSVLVPWDRSIRPCLHAWSFDADPDAPSDPGGGWRGFTCMDTWQ